MRFFCNAIIWLKGHFQIIFVCHSSGDESNEFQFHFDIDAEPSTCENLIDSIEQMDGRIEENDGPMNFSIESISEHECHEQNPTEMSRKRKRERHNWRDGEKFDTMAAARSFLQGFGMRDRKILKDGSAKTKFRCAFAKRRGRKCAAERIIYEPSDQKDVYIIQYNGKDHTHEELAECDKSHKFSLEMIDLIVECSKKKDERKKYRRTLD